MQKSLQELHDDNSVSNRSGPASLKRVCKMRQKWLKYFQECSVSSNSSMFIMKMVGRILIPTFTVDIRGLAHEALVKEITEKMTKWIAINLQKAVFFLRLKVIAKLLAVVCNHAKKCLCARVLLLLSLFLQHLSCKLLMHVINSITAVEMFIWRVLVRILFAGKHGCKALNR